MFRTHLLMLFCVALLLSGCITTKTPLLEDVKEEEKKEQSTEEIDDAFAAHSRGDYTTALAILRPLAAEGDAMAQFYLGLMYHKGEGVAQDHTKAVRWWRKAAEQGHSRAQYNLALSYEKGLGVAQNYAEAIRWCRKAADQGHAGAQCNLGV